MYDGYRGEPLDEINENVNFDGDFDFDDLPIRNRVNKSSPAVRKKEREILCKDCSRVDRQSRRVSKTDKGIPNDGEIGSRMSEFHPKFEAWCTLDMPLVISEQEG